MYKSILIMLEKIWTSILDIIHKNITEQQYNTWFVPIKPLSFVNNILTVEVPNNFFYDWLEEHYVNIINTAIQEVINEQGQIKYSICKDSNDNNSKQSKNKIKLNISNTFNFRLNKNYTFDNFIEGACNSLARSSALSIAKKPYDNPFNPLTIYGNVGLGKTHLINAIGNEILKNFNDKNVIYIPANHFVNQFINSIQKNQVNSFLEYYYSIDVLILDDIQFLKNKDKTQETLFHIFNYLHQNGKQIILTSDCNLNDCEGIHDRLISRFQWGLTVDLSIPDMETKIAIMRSKITDKNIDISILEYIANRTICNIRELEGILHSLMNIYDQNCSLSKIDYLLSKQNFQRTNIDINVSKIIQIISDYFQIDKYKIMSKNRQKDIAMIRQILMYLIRKKTSNSLENIGNIVGGRNYSTVIHSINNVEKLMKQDQRLRSKINDLESRL